MFGNGFPNDFMSQIINKLKSKYGLKDVEVTTIDIDLFKFYNKVKPNSALCKLDKDREVLICITNKGLIIEDLLDLYDEHYQI